MYRNKTLYLNNHGSRWVYYDWNGKKNKIWLYLNGRLIQRTVLFYESFGNFACACISFKGKRYKVLNYTFYDDKIDISAHNNTFDYRP